MTGCFKVCRSAMLVWLGLMLLFAASASAGAPRAGDALPAIELEAPTDPGLSAYLGVDAGSHFTIPEIKARVVIVEIFSMYCPYCQKEAPNVNALFDKIQADSKLRPLVKLIGIGAGNSAYEVQVFRDTYKIRFPLFPDGDFSIHKCVGEVRTPFFMAVQLDPQGPPQLVYAAAGALQDVDAFLQKVTAGVIP